MKFSLIMATLGRSSEVERLFRSLAEQTYRNFELIVVDQNNDDRVTQVIERFKDQFQIVYCRSEKGLSRARNVGLQAVSGDIVAFPDDDCWYPPQVLEFVADKFGSEAELAGVTGCSVDGDNKPSQGRWSTTPLIVNRYNIWTCATSYTIFLRTESVRAVGGFDEQLGVGSGSRWGAGEEVNFLLGVLNAGYKVRYEPALRVCHPEPITTYDEKAYARGRLYNRGFGRVLSLNRYPMHFVLYVAARPAAGCVMSILQGDLGRARYYWIAATNRVLGWVDQG
ncbi:Glycosyl transferase family 2 [Burkholderia sp. D7]|nr:Glycosyl transferase family 2 [Burkholderia sp. D7]